MSRRIDKINSLIQQIFGEILQREADLPNDVLVTISRVDTTPNLKATDIWLYINPAEQAKEIVEQLSGQLYDLQGELNRALDLKILPRIRLRIDYGAENADSVETTLKGLE